MSSTGRKKRKRNRNFTAGGKSDKASLHAVKRNCKGSSYFEEQGNTYIVMEIPAGNQPEALSGMPGRTSFFLKKAEICSFRLWRGWKRCTGKHILHRDLTPDNLCSERMGVCITRFRFTHEKLQRMVHTKDSSFLKRDVRHRNKYEKLRQAEMNRWLQCLCAVCYEIDHRCNSGSSLSKRERMPSTPLSMVRGYAGAGEKVLLKEWHLDYTANAIHLSERN